MTRPLHRWLTATVLAITGSSVMFQSPANAQAPVDVRSSAGEENFAGEGDFAGPDARGVYSTQADVRLRRPTLSSSIAPPSAALPSSISSGLSPSEMLVSPGIPPRASFDSDREQLFNDLAYEFSTFDRLGNLVKRVAHLVGPSVVHIEAHKTENSAGQHEAYDEAGAGVVLDFGGESWVLTNRHVVVGSQPNEIMLRSSDGREFSPTRVLVDASTDIAVLKLDMKNNLAQSIVPARLGDSNGVEIGDFVIAIGSPFGLSHSVTFGIVSAKGRRDLSLGEQKIELQDFFQTDAAINPGNSGGPLINLRGELVALNTAIASSSGGSEGIGFAIPINMAVQVADQLIRYGKLRRGYLGVTLEPEFTPADMVAAGYQASGGALVKNVRPGSPAAIARIQRGDIIVEFAGNQVESDDHLVAQVGLTPLNTKVPMIIFRNGNRYSTSVVLVDLQ
jgi:serine protease Do